MLNLDVDAAKISKLRHFTQAIGRGLPGITSRAMNAVGVEAKKAVSDTIFPMIKGGPVNWTKRGLIHVYANPNRLDMWVGFNPGADANIPGFRSKSGGVPAGRYMGLNARGGDRRPKSFELALRRAGKIGGNDFVIPRSNWKSVNKYGNVPASKYTQILSRVRALPTGIGDAANGAGSRGRSGAKQSSLDFFVARGDESGISRWQLGTQAIFIAQRRGRKPKGGTGKGTNKRGRPQTIGYRRGFIAVMTILQDQAPEYERGRFPIVPTIEATVKRRFPPELRSRIARAITDAENRRLSREFGFGSTTDFLPLAMR
jgi:hypothetical protein